MFKRRNRTEENQTENRQNNPLYSNGYKVVGKRAIPVCAMLAVVLGSSSIIAFAKGGVPDVTLNQDPNEVISLSVEVDDDVYKGFMGMINYFKDYDGKGLSADMKAATSASAISDADKDSDHFIERNGNLYIIVNAKEYQVVETEDGLCAIDSDGNEDPIEVVAPEMENPNVHIAEDGSRYYHIVWGDTLCKISSMFHYSVDELAEHNHIKNPNLIYAESDLRLPDAE